MRTSERGRAGEDAVAGSLEAQGFEIVARNARIGRLELDLVARRGGLVVFCEVKSAGSEARFGPEERLSVAQQGRLRRAAAGWLRAHPQGAVEMRFDAAFVRLPESAGGEPHIAYFEGAF